MAKTSTPPNAPPESPRRETGQTTPQSGAVRAPKLPHERDESSTSQQGAPSDLMQKAHDDIADGRVDTSRGEATDPTYARELRSQPQGGAADRGAASPSGPRSE